MKRCHEHLPLRIVADLISKEWGFLLEASSSATSGRSTEAVSYNETALAFYAHVAQLVETMNYCCVCKVEIGIGRKACSLSCSGKLGATGLSKNIKYLNQWKDEYAQSPSICTNCSVLLPYKRRTNKYCSHSCATIVNNKKRDSRILTFECQWCGVASIPIKNGARKYCSSTCCGKHKYAKTLNKWKESPEGHSYLPRSIKKYFLEKFNNKCVMCGWDKVHNILGYSPLELHHIDGNKKNNNEDNIVILCPNCHSLTDTFKAIKRIESH